MASNVEIYSYLGVTMFTLFMVGLYCLRRHQFYQKYGALLKQENRMVKCSEVANGVPQGLVQARPVVTTEQMAQQTVEAVVVPIEQLHISRLPGNIPVATQADGLAVSSGEPVPVARVDRQSTRNERRMSGPQTTLAGTASSQTVPLPPSQQQQQQPATLVEEEAPSNAESNGGLNSV